MQTEVRHLTREEQQVIQRALLQTWEPVSEPAIRVICGLRAALDRQLDTRWIHEYLEWNDSKGIENG